MSFTFTREQLSSVIGNNPDLDGWYEALSSVLPTYEIDSPQRVAAFIAQCTHESGGFKRLKENLNYKAESLVRVFPKYFPSLDLAKQYAHDQEKIANRVYGSRMGNGDESSGDGFRYCGRGLIQLTGRNNYTKFSESIGMAVEEVPSLLETFEGAVKSACWFWKTNNLNQYADAGDILTMTKRINGGTIGLEDRIKHYNHALEVFSS
jgi:putative chitinase